MLLLRSGLSFASPGAEEGWGKLIGKFVEIMRFIAVARTCGPCVVHCLRAFVANASVRTLQSHSVVNLCANVLSITSSVNCGTF